MTHRRPGSPGSFEDDLGRVIERMAPGDHKLPTKPHKPIERRVSGVAELNDRLFEKTWRKGA